MRDLVEGDDASRMVHIDCNSVRHRWCRQWNLFPFHLVPDKVAIFTAPQSPGRSIWFKVTVLFQEARVYCFKPLVSTPFHSFITHSYEHISLPLNLPVTASSETIFALNLTEIRWHWYSHFLCRVPWCHFSVVIRQLEAAVCCIRVQTEFTSIWLREYGKTEEASFSCNVICIS